MIDRLEQSKALANESRLAILDWLRSPWDHFSHQVTGDPREIGVCVTLLTEKLCMAQPTVSRHLELLRRSEFVTVERIGRWAFYKRNEPTIVAYKEWLNESV